MISQRTYAWPRGTASSVVKVEGGSLVEIGKGGQVGDICNSVNNKKIGLRVGIWFLNFKISFCGSYSYENSFQILAIG